MGYNIQASLLNDSTKLLCEADRGRLKQTQIYYLIDQSDQKCNVFWEAIWKECLTKHE